MTKLDDTVIAQALERTLQYPVARNGDWAKQVAAFLIEQRQTTRLDAVLRRMAALRQAQGVVEATVTVARPLSLANRTALEALIKAQVPHAQHITWRIVLDPVVIGGIRLQVAGLELDATIRHQLQQLTQTK